MSCSLLKYQTPTSMQYSVDNNIGKKKENKKKISYF